MKAILLPAFVLALGVAMPNSLSAQTDEAAPTDPAAKKTNEEQGNRRFWQASLPGGSITIALDRITSISKHEYLLDGAVVVTEVTIDTIGQALVRFYYLQPPGQGGAVSTPARVIERSRELLDAAGQRAGVGQNMSDMVAKKYPETTHAKEIEYRLADMKQLDALYQSAQAAWESGRGRKINVQ
jgi:hypothetical protein